MTISDMNPFGYIPGRSALHRTDARFKLIFLLMLSPSVIQASMASALLFGLLLCWLCMRTGFPVKQMFNAIPFLSIMLVFILAARSITGENFNGSGFSFSISGFLDGVLICLKLVEIIIVGGLFTFTTRISEIKAGLEWLLRPVPFVSGKRIALMIGLMVRFIPVMIERAGDIQMAQQARSADGRRNYFTRLKLLIMPLMRRIVLEADKLSEAMESRCYSEHATPPDFGAGSISWASLMVAACVSVFLWMV